MEGVCIFLDTLLIVVAIFLVVMLRFTIKSYEKSPQEESSQDNGEEEIDNRDDFEEYYVCVLKENYSENRVLDFNRTCDYIEFQRPYEDECVVYVLFYNNNIGNNIKQLVGMVPIENILSLRLVRK